MKQDYNYKPLHQRIKTKTINKLRKITGQTKKPVNLENFKHIEVE